MINFRLFKLKFFNEYNKINELIYHYHHLSFFNLKDAYPLGNMDINKETKIN